MSKIHYATGGLITPEKSEFSTLCGRKFRTGTSDIMQSGYTGAKNVTCEDCRWILTIQEQKSSHTWYEVTEGGSTKRFKTREEAQLYLKDMRRGFPKNTYMSLGDKAYWKKVGKRHYIQVVHQTSQTISY